MSDFYLIVKKRSDNDKIDYHAKAYIAHLAKTNYV